MFFPAWHSQQRPIDVRHVSWIELMAIWHADIHCVKTHEMDQHGCAYWLWEQKNWWILVLLMVQKPNNHLRCMKPVNNGINYQPQLVSRISEPSTVWHGPLDDMIWHHGPSEPVYPRWGCREACSCIPTNFRDTHRLGSLDKTKTVTLMAAGLGRLGRYWTWKNQACFFKAQLKKLSSNVGTSRNNIFVGTWKFLSNTNCL